jgi:hypothetical protein
MTSTASDLSAPQYGYDLVCAVTQDGINKAMLAFLSQSSQEISACYVADVNGNPVLVPLSQIEVAIGGDPFAVPDGANQTNASVSALDGASFLYAFKAKLGVPAKASPVPEVIKLDQGNSQVTYQLFCAEFSIIVMNYLPGGRCIFSNLVQPAAAPWLFVYHVNMNLNPAVPTPYNQLPPAAQARIKNLDPSTMFSVQQLLIDVTTRGLESVPQIAGLSQSSPAFIALTEVFINTYWNNLAPGKSILVGYNVAPAEAIPALPPSIVPTSLNFEIVPYQPPGGGAFIGGLNTLNYLVMSNDTPMPPAVPFSWNWIEAADEKNFDGAMAVRRDIFANFLSGLISPASANLSVNTNISMSHDGEDFTTTLNATWPGPNPGVWTRTPAGTPAGPDGFTPLMTISYACASYDSSEDELHLSSINGDFNYNLTGDVSVSGNLLRLTIRGVAFAEFNAHIMGIPAANLEANIVDLTSIVTYTLSTTSGGELQATMSTTSPNPIDNSQSIDFSTWDNLIGLSGVADMINSMKAQLTASFGQSLEGFEEQIEDLINGSCGWVYPGGQTFFFEDVAFSGYQDLVSRVTYLSAPAFEALQEPPAERLIAIPVESAPYAKPVLEPA